MLAVVLPASGEVLSTVQRLTQWDAFTHTSCLDVPASSRTLRLSKKLSLVKGHLYVSGSSVCPPLALDCAVGVLCRLLKQWGSVPEGVLSLTEWLLGDEEVNQEEAESGEEPSLVIIELIKTLFIYFVEIS
ncbi:hypothetical protein WMY93_018016 [Mugilogobius chulae]|uniref:Uncharacterized protein n=1 Tax=Mugilogobius chulae TaxID=88201 RepID=A0AAW0NSP9_9GOBI